MWIFSRGMSRSARRVLAACTFAIALAWLAYGFSREAHRTLDLEALRPNQARPAILWRPSTPQARRLHAFLERAKETIPAGSRAAFATEATPSYEGFFRFLWAAYLFSDRLLIPEDAPEAQEVEFWVTFRRPLERPDMLLLLEHGPGRVYRRSFPGEAR